MPELSKEVVIAPVVDEHDPSTGDPIVRWKVAAINAPACNSRAVGIVLGLEQPAEILDMETAPWADITDLMHDLTRVGVSVRLLGLTDRQRPADDFFEPPTVGNRVI